MDFEKILLFIAAIPVSHSAKAGFSFVFMDRSSCVGLVIIGEPFPHDADIGVIFSVSFALRFRWKMAIVDKAIDLVAVLEDDVQPIVALTPIVIADVVRG